MMSSLTKFLLVWVVALSFAALVSGCGSNSKGASSNAPTVSTFPVKVGEVGPIAADNPLQQPFACVTQDTALGQPVVDNQDGIGFPVTDSNGNVIGYSKNCLAPTKVSYYYRETGDAATDPLHAYDPTNPPTDVADVTIDGNRVPFIVRFEQGTINRFIYSIEALTPTPDISNPDKPDLSGWNHDLIFYFIGGVGIGHTQSHNGNALRAVKTPGEQTGALALLAKGYAIVNSTGAATSTTYNLKLGGETAKMVKQQFVAVFGKPTHTFGLGASGGAVQQFVYAQNDPGLIDALIPIQPFPDMITQINPVGDCELLQYYFDRVDAQVNGTGTLDPKWKSWANRQEIIGLHGIDGFKTYNAIGTSANPGGDVCIQEWLGAIPLLLNPLFGATTEGSFSVIDPAILNLIPLGYFDDLINIFGAIPGTDIARSTYDNTGVQYGLQALKDGKITVHEFLDINAHVGGWKPLQDFVAPGFPYEGNPTAGNIDPWSSRNATAEDHLDPSDVAPRTQGSIPAMQAAYNAGLVFRGDLKKPIIIIEPYLEPELNEHASREPFAVRQRLIEAKGNADNLAIWMIGSGSDALETPFMLQALNDETQWLNSGSKPSTVADACYDARGTLIASGSGVFAGEVTADGQVPEGTQTGGACTNKYPIYSDARVISGLNVSDHVFKCALKPVSTALTDGTYGNIPFSAVQKARLQQIFQTGVCDYSKPDQGLPTGA